MQDSTAPKLRAYFGTLPSQKFETLSAAMIRPQRKWLAYHWQLLAHDGQIAPPGNWSTWMLMAGRGYGKTRAGAEWVRRIAEHDGHARIALVAASLAEARAVMVEGDSGLLAVAPPKYRPTYESSRQLLRWPTGAQARIYSAAEPETLRGPQHSHAWCDELAKWGQAGGRAGNAWDNLLLGMRLGGHPRIMVTTTPRTVPLVRRLVDDPSAVVTGGRTQDNRHNLSPMFVDIMHRQFGGTTLGRQELDGELLTDVEGALWNRAMLERCRMELPAEPAVRIVVGVDPPISATGDACGIVVAQIGESGSATVLADCTAERASPERWARAVAQASAAWSADRIVAEANQGGAMVEHVLRAADIALPVKLVHASRGKVARAEPVAALYEAGRVRHAGMFAQLEDQLCELMLGRRGQPRVRVV